MPHTPNYMPDAVRGLSLDIWGTLLRSHPDFKPKRNAMLRAALFDGPYRGDFDVDLRHACQASDLAAIGDGDDRGLFETLATIQPRPKPVLSEGEKARILEDQAQIAREFPPRPLNDRLPDQVHRISQYIPVAVTSNTGLLPGTLMRELLTLAGFQGVSVYSFSDETFCGAKPWPPIFKNTMRGMRVPASGILHVGDNYVADVLGAHGVGMQAALVRGYDAEATSAVLDELLEVLEA